MATWQKLANDAQAVVATTLPLRWGAADAAAIADLELERVLDDLSEIDDGDHQRDAVRFLLLSLGWHAASDRLQRAASKNGVAGSPFPRTGRGHTTVATAQ